MFGTAAVIALPAAWAIALLGPADLAAADARTWLVVAWLGVVATRRGFLLFSSALRFISGATGVALALGEPLTAFTLAVLLLGEPLRASGVAGIALILAGLALVIAASAAVETMRADGATPSLLIIGCGDVGLRVVRALGGRLRVFALTSSPARCDALRAAGVRPWWATWTIPPRWAAWPAWPTPCCISRRRPRRTAPTRAWARCWPRSAGARCRPAWSMRARPASTATAAATA